MLEILFIQFIKILFDFTCLVWFIKRRRKAFIILRVPTLVVLLVFTLELFSLLDLFLKLEGSKFGCASYGVMYGYLPLFIIMLYTIISSRYFIGVGNNTDSNFCDILKRICVIISGKTVNEQHWDSKKQVQRLKTQNFLNILLMTLLPGAIDIVVYFGIIGGFAFSNFSGYDCKPWFNIVTLVFAIAGVLLNVALCYNIGFHHDLFKIKNTFQVSMLGLIVYSVIWSVSTYSFPSKPEDLNLAMAIVLQISNTLCIMSFTVYPIYLSRYSGDIKLNIKEIWNQKNLKNRFIDICESSFCGQYVQYLQEVDTVDFSKPLLVQKLCRKYFDIDSPFYLDIFHSSWFLDFSNPSFYTFKVAKDQVMLFLQENVVFYLDESTLSKSNIDHIKINMDTYRRFTTFARIAEVGSKPTLKI